MRAQGKELAGDIGGSWVPEKKGRGKEKALTGRGQQSVRERRGRASAARAGRKWAGARPTREKGKRGESWASGKLGPGKRGRERGFGLMGCCLLLLFFFFSTLKLLKQIHLNSNKFEFKPYKLNTREIMLQHECTNMLLL
jgi:hypothetical protein